MASSTPFVHLHNHTTYSLLDGAQKIDELCKRAAEDGQSAAAITDHGNLFGVMEFGKSCKKNGIKPIIGTEAYIAPGDRRERAPKLVNGVGRKNYYHLILLAKDYTGYKNLIKLSSHGYLDGFYYRPRIDKELLREHSEGLICLSACLASEIATLLRHDQLEAAEQAAAEYRDLFDEGRYWLEIQDHGIPEQKKVNELTVELSKKLGVPMVATNDCHYLYPNDHFAHDVLCCIQTGKTVNSRDRMTYSKQHYLKSGDEMAKLFDWAPESVENSVRIADMCDFAFTDQPLRLPEFPIPDGYDIDGYFAKVAKDGLEARMHEIRAEIDAGRIERTIEEYHERLDKEIKIIHQMGYSGYFLITWDFIRFAHEQGIPVGPGRGSAAGSLVAYAMKITNIDPLRYNLLFERFLNPERVSMPDIDIDFCFRQRERVIDYVTHKYGRENVSQIITFGTMAARAVLRDVGRGLDMSYDQVDKIAKMVPAQPGQEITIDMALEEVKPLREAYEGDPKVKEMIDVAKRLEGLTRHASTHAAGVVITPKPIMEYCPLYKGTREGDEITTQWAKDEVEEIGLLKLDFLGLKTLTLIDDCLGSIERVTGERPDLEALPLDDPKTYELFCKARTSGVFQFESEGMKGILRRLKPERFEDLIALNALYRPGPIGGGLIDDFIGRRHGKIEVEYPHPMLEEVLEETYGVIVYQEQVMQIASKMAGYSLGDADILRRAMGKKKKEVMEAEAKRFVEGADKMGTPAAEAKKVFELMAFFAGYGFNKSHSAAYALVAYHTAWLKAHHPVHFMAALLTNDKGNTEKLVKYINECRDMGIEVEPPAINASGVDFTVDGPSIRFGLSAIKGVGEGAIRCLLEAREEGEAFESLHDICSRVDGRTVNKRVLEALVQSGSLDGFGARRSQLAMAIDGAIDFGQKQRADALAGQASLFGGDDDSEPAAPPLPEIPEWEDRERLAGEKQTLGFYISGHPLDDHRDLLERYSSHDTAMLKTITSKTQVALGGMITDLQRRKSRKGDMWASFALEDLSGQIDVLCFPRTYEKCQALLDNDVAIMLEGRVEAEEERVRVIASDVLPLEQLRERRVDAVQLKLEAGEIDDDLVDRLRRMMEKHPGDVRVFFEVARPGQYRMLARAESQVGINPSEDFLSEVESLLGPQRLRFRAKPGA